MPDKTDSLEAANGLRHAVTERLLKTLTEVAELKAELRVGMRALDDKLDRSLHSVHEKLDRMLVLEQKVEDHSKSITRLKTWWSVLAAGVAVGVSALREWLVKGR